MSTDFLTFFEQIQYRTNRCVIRIISEKECNTKASDGGECISALTCRIKPLFSSKDADLDEKPTE